MQWQLDRMASLVSEIAVAPVAVAVAAITQQAVAVVQALLVAMEQQQVVRRHNQVELAEPVRLRISLDLQRITQVVAVVVSTVRHLLQMVRPPLPLAHLVRAESVVAVLLELKRMLQA
jgi:hypothetical protein